MGLYKYVREAWKQPKKNMSELWRERLISWRRQPTTIRIERPTRIDKARSVGYKAKQGYILVRQKVLRGGHVRSRVRKRRPRNMGTRIPLATSYKTIAEQRANKKYPNCEVLNSYEVAKDGKYYWFEIILIDKSHPSIRADKRINWISKNKHKGRVFRGLTSSSKKSRGLRNKGKGAEKIRPSQSASHKRKIRKQ